MNCVKCLIFVILIFMPLSCSGPNYPPDIIELQKSVEKKPKDPSLYKELIKALELDPFNKDILYNYGVWLLRESKYNESIQFLNKLVSQNPQEESPYLRLGKAYYHSHEMALAEKSFWDASRFDSTVKTLAEIVHVQDLYSTHKEVNTARVDFYPITEKV